MSRTIFVQSDSSSNLSMDDEILFQLGLNVIEDVFDKLDFTVTF